jgi:hypothetical protein
MRFINYLRLALTLVAIVGLLCLPTGAHAATTADVTGTASSASAPTAGDQPAASPSGPSADGAGSPSGSSPQSQASQPTQSQPPSDSGSGTATAGSGTAPAGTVTASSTSSSAGTVTAGSGDSTGTTTTTSTSSTPATGSAATTPTQGATASNSGATATSNSGAAATASPSGASASTPATGQSTTAAESNATTQTIWQVQISGCTDHCQAQSQTQSATQQNTTVQAEQGAPTVLSATAQTGTNGASTSSSRIVQVQIGCMVFCFGTTVTTTAKSKRALRALKRLMKLLEALLPQRQIPDSVQASEQNIVDQTAHQWQKGDGLAVVQSQSATQDNATIQTIDLSSALTAELQAAFGSGSSPAAAIINQSMQTIWQLQIGCLFSCVDTTQQQQAAQSNTTVQVLLPAVNSETSSPTTATNQASQLIWQLQIGCLFWCYDATQQQTATSTNTAIVVVAGPPVPTGPVQQATGIPAGGGASQSGPTTGAVAPVPGAQPPATTLVQPPPSSPTAGAHTKLPGHHSSGSSRHVHARHHAREKSHHRTHGTKRHVRHRRHAHAHHTTRTGDRD